ncbi:MAG: thioredoxin domain-containing protein [Myxococcota bacterium]
MERPRTSLTSTVPMGISAALAILSLGASCGDDGPSGTITNDNNTGGEDISELPGLDLSDLTRSEQRTWRQVVNDQLSPCGDPVSVAQCVAENRDCDRCAQAVRYVARLVIEGHDRNQIDELYGFRYDNEEVVEIPIGDAPVRGAAMAPITIVEFSDFECPYCGRAHPVLTRALREFQGQVRLVFMQYPLDGHDHAGPAARASIAAGNQGKFWQMHDLLFENQRALEPEDLVGYAEDLGLDLTQFRNDMLAEETQARVVANKELGRELGVSGTPTIFINGRRFREAPEALISYLREELE